MIQQHIREKKNCVGCGACIQRCPKNCIELVRDDEGFLYPCVNQEECIDCGTCDKTCPTQSVQRAELPKTFKSCYIAYSKDEEIRQNSSSGGIFSELARETISNGGLVVGAAYDDKLMVRHIVVDNIEDLKQLRGSKYVQSELGNIYDTVRIELEKGREVLFSGTGCQVAGLKAYLQCGVAALNSGKLITVEVMCHGVTSPMVWEKYLTEKNVEEIRIINFRDKSESWRNYSVVFVRKDGTIIREKNYENPYMKLFIGNMILRPSCYDCKFKELERCSDITIGDCWSINNVKPEMNDDRGISVILTHSENGEELINRISDNLVMEESDVEKAFPKQSDARKSVNKPANRECIIGKISEGESIESVAKEVGTRRTRNVIKNTMSGIGVKMLLLIMNFILRMVFIRYLGIQYAGVSGLFVDILNILSFTELGIGTAITYSLYKPIAQNDELQIAKLMNFYRDAYRWVAVTIFGIGICLIPFLDILVKDVPDIKENIAIIYIMYLLNTALSYLLIYKSAILVAKQKRYVVSKIEGAMSIIRLVIEITVVVVFRNFMLYLIVEIIRTVTQNLWISHVASREYRHIPEAHLNRQEKLSIYADVAGLAIYQVAGAIISGADSTIISAIVGTTLVGVLCNYKMITGSVNMVIQQFYSGANASVGNLVVEGNADRQRKVFEEINFAVFWLTTFCVSCFVMLFDPFIEVWVGEQYQLSHMAILFLVVDFYIYNMVRAVGLFRTANGLFKQGKIRMIIMVIINVVLSIVLAKPFGIEGVLFATIVARLVTQIWYDPMLVYREAFKEKVINYFKTYVCYLGVAVIAVGLTYFIGMWIVMDNRYVELVLRACVCVIVPNVVIVVMCHMTHAFKRLMKRISRRPEAL